MSICLIDTSVFSIYITAPKTDRAFKDVDHRLRKLIGDRATLLLPMATIVETGNQVARYGDGRRRREAANRFVEAVGKAIDGAAPWTPTPFFEAEALRTWLAEFPDHAMQGKGLGDVSIIKEFERQCALHVGHDVFIWSHDEHLAGYHRPAKNHRARK
jgi:predicted nucleic acid-binding protein